MLNDVKLINNNLTNNLTERIHKIIHKLSENDYIYIACISGPVGIGKTTTCEKFNNLIKNSINRDLFNYYNEWISHRSLSQNMMDACSNGLISRLTLQSYILDEWNSQLKNKPLTQFNLFERSISECSLCFIDDLSLSEQHVLQEIENKIAKKYNIPSIVTKTSFYEISETKNTLIIIDEIISIIEKDLTYMIQNNKNTFNRIFGMKLIDPEILLKRIRNRNRSGEENIDIEQVRKNNLKYIHAYMEFKKTAEKS